MQRLRLRLPAAGMSENRTALGAPHGCRPSPGADRVLDAIHNSSANGFDAL
jgi:hypothetical protein